MGRTPPDTATKDPEVNKAVSAIAKQLGMSDLDALKVLVSAGAEKIAKDTGAKAFVAGKDIRLSNSSSKSRIGHELTHTLQQGTPLQQSVGKMERAAKQAAFFKSRANASSDGSN